MNQAFSEFQRSIELIFQMEERKAQTMRKELSKMPAGTLVLKRTYGKTYFVRNTEDRSVSIKDDMELVYSLARKRYLTLRLKEHEMQYRRHKDRHNVKTSPSPVTKRIRKLLDRYKDAKLDLMRITLTPQQYHWAHEEFPHDVIEEGVVIYKTYSGVEMRSKSERTIGNELELEGIPYRYGQRFVLDVSWIEAVRGNVYDGNKAYYPDFVILTISGELIIWEHLGRLDLLNYRLRNAEKLAALRQGGYCSEEMLILTVEHDLEDGNFIRNLIARRILPYM